MKLIVWLRQKPPIRYRGNATTVLITAAGWYADFLLSGGGDQSRHARDGRSWADLDIALGTVEYQLSMPFPAAEIASRVRGKPPMISIM